ncbi:MAG: MspA1I restriction endonuclease [Dehalococcoidia bacterium]|nr:MspA1I restriction endonuclease [Dehalococcoidia bacterium]
MTDNWTQKIIEYCQEYSIPIEYLSDTLYEPKVVPMIRGKVT